LSSFYSPKELYSQRSNKLWTKVLEIFSHEINLPYSQRLILDYKRVEWSGLEAICPVFQWSNTWLIMAAHVDFSGFQMGENQKPILPVTKWFR
jgi:hypothetical protein